MINMKADSAETMVTVLHSLENMFQVGTKLWWLFVVGDGKTYNILQGIKRKYSKDMQWLLLHP